MHDLLTLTLQAYLSLGLGTAVGLFHGMFRGMIPKRWHPRTFWQVGAVLLGTIVAFPWVMRWLNSGRPWQ